jgi:hypothetical protein
MQNKKNMTDITDLSDAALDVVLAVKAGEECVVVEHLTAKERYQVCEALGVSARSHWINNTPYEAAPKSRVSRFDYEGAILAEQEERFND